MKAGEQAEDRGSWRAGRRKSRRRLGDAIALEEKEITVQGHGTGVTL